GRAHGLARHARGRHVRRPRRRQRDRRADRPAGADGVAGIRLRRHHRRLRRPAASSGRSAREPAHVAALPGRRVGAARARPAVVGDRHVPGHAAVLPARRRRADPLPGALAVARARGSGMSATLIGIVALTLAAGTPLVIAALGELVVERAGVLNLGVEGMMLIGAVTGFIVTVHTHEPWLGIAAGVGAGGAMSLVFGAIALTLQANQVATGLALSLFGIGLSGFVGMPYVSAV